MLELLFFVGRGIFTLYLYAVLLYFLLSTTRVNLYHPVMQALGRFINPLLQPFRLMLPTVKGVDTAILVFLLFLQVMEFVVVGLIIDFSMAALTVVFVSVITLLCMTLNVYFYSLLIQVVMSWFSQSPTPIGDVLYRLNEPLLRPVRRLLPSMAGIDFSPLLVLLLLQFAYYFLRSLLHYA